MAHTRRGYLVERFCDRYSQKFGGDMPWQLVSWLYLMAVGETDVAGEMFFLEKDAASLHPWIGTQMLKLWNDLYNWKEDDQPALVQVAAPVSTPAVTCQLLVVGPELPVTPPELPVTESELPVTALELQVTEPQVQVTGPELPVTPPELPVTPPEPAVAVQPPLEEIELGCDHPPDSLPLIKRILERLPSAFTLSNLRLMVQADNPEIDHRLLHNETKSAVQHMEWLGQLKRTGQYDKVGGILWQRTSISLSATENHNHNTQAVVAKECGRRWSSIVRFAEEFKLQYAQVYRAIQKRKPQANGMLLEYETPAEKKPKAQKIVHEISAKLDAERADLKLRDSHQPKKPKSAVAASLLADPPAGWMCKGCGEVSQTNKHQCVKCHSGGWEKLKPEV